MKVKAGKYTIVSDSLGNFHITETKTRERNGETKEYETRVSGYCRTPQEAVNDMFKRKVYSSDVTTLEEVVDVIKQEMAVAMEILNNA